MNTINDNLTNDLSLNVKGKSVLNLSLRRSKVRIHNKLNGNGVVRKMKIHIDLNKEESEGFKSFISMVKPDAMNENDFVKMIFLKGVEAVNTHLTEEARKYIESHPELFDASGSPVPNVEVL